MDIKELELQIRKEERKLEELLNEVKETEFRLKTLHSGIESHKISDVDTGDLIYLRDEDGEKITVVITESYGRYGIVLLSKWNNRELKPYYSFGCNCIFPKTSVKSFIEEYNLKLLSIKRVRD